MFAFLTRARPWRGWMRGSRTACGRQCVDASSAHLTQWSCRRSLKTFSREKCAASETLITLIQRRKEHFLPGDSSGRWTQTRQSFTADRLTGDAPETALLSQGKRGRGVRLKSAPGSDLPTLQAPAALSRALRAPALTVRTGRHRTQINGPRSRRSSSLRNRRSSSLRSRRSSRLRSRRISDRSDSSGAGEM